MSAMSSLASYNGYRLLGPSFCVYFAATDLHCHWSPTMRAIYGCTVHTVCTPPTPRGPCTVQAGLIFCVAFRRANYLRHRGQQEGRRSSSSPSSWRAQASPTRPEEPSLASVGSGMAAGAPHSAFGHGAPRRGRRPAYGSVECGTSAPSDLFQSYVTQMSELLMQRAMWMRESARPAHYNSHIPRHRALTPSHAPSP